ncbi:TolC family protein [Flavobacterium sp.]|uniref:TolC family protein n=1 Tax=Flavobacterium sp. TaxID=239 RepID=UPI0025D62B53|nr:TolC family protein [Flavobacterium sp.]
MKLKFSIIFFLFIIKSFSQEKDLIFYIQKAQSNSPLLKDLSNQIKSNKIDSLINRANYKPQIKANLNAYYAPILDGFGYDLTLSNGQTVSGLVGINKKIIGKNQINTQGESYQLLKEAILLNKKVAIKELNKLIIGQYITASGTAQQLDYNKKMGFLLKDESSILKKLTQNSIYKQTDYLLFLSTVKQQELQLLQLKQQYQNDLGLLNYLSGETDTTFVNLKKPNITIQESFSNSKSVFLKQFEVDSLKIINQNKLINNAYKPSLSLLGDAGYLSAFVLDAHKNFGFSVGLGLSIPVYDGNQKSLQHQKNQTALNTNLAYKTNFNKQYQQQLLLLRQKLQQAIAIENQLQLQLQIVDALIEANKKLLLTGDAQITDYVIAIGNVITINNTISQNKINTLQLINEINYWNNND